VIRRDLLDSGRPVILSIEARQARRPQHVNHRHGGSQPIRIRHGVDRNPVKRLPRRPDQTRFRTVDVGDVKPVPARVRHEVSRLSARNLEGGTMRDRDW